MSRSIGDSILILGVCLFGSWSVFCYAMVFSGSSFSDLKVWSIVPLLIGVLIGTLCAGDFSSTPAGSIKAGSELKTYSETRWVGLWLLLGLSMVTIILRGAGAPYWSVWLTLLCTAILVFRTDSRSTALRSQPKVQLLTLQNIGILALASFGAVLVAITHRPDFDDSQYLNFIVTAIDFPAEPLFSRSGMWQDHSVPLESPVYRFHTYELFVAVLSDTLGVDHKTLYYLILAPMFGALSVLVHWRLAQYLVPGHALSILVAWLVLTITLGETHREFGNFAFVRLYQGKAIMVTVILPLCLLLGIRFAESPDWRRGLAVALTVIASLGMSSSGLVAAPIVAGAALSGGFLGASRRSVLIISAGVLVLVSVLAIIGSDLLTKMNVGAHGNFRELMQSAGGGLSIVVGGGTLGSLILASFPLAPLFVNEGRRHRLYATTTLVFVVVVLNPWAAPFLAAMLDSTLLWRLFWSVPLVLSASISLAGLLAIATERLPVLVRHAVLPIMLGAVLLSAERLSISPENEVVIAFPRYKVEPIAHEIAAEIVRDAPARSTVYAPNGISLLITTFRFHPYPLIVRPEYLGFGRIRKHFGLPELERRSRVINFLEGSDKDPSTVAFFQQQLATDAPSFVVYDHRVELAPVIAAVLRVAGYFGERRDIYWLWRSP